MSLEQQSPLEPFVFVCEGGALWHVVELNYCDHSKTKCGRDVRGLVVALSPVAHDPAVKTARDVAWRNGYVVESTVPDCRECFGKPGPDGTARFHRAAFCCPVPPPVYLDQRLHLSLGAFTADQLDAVRGLFVHDNPEYEKWFKYKPTRFPPKKTVGTWRQSEGYLHVPRGRLDDVLAIIGATSKIDDRRQVGSTHHFKIKGIEARDYQTRLVDTAQRLETCCWRSPQGCLAGDSIISINRGGKGFAISIERLVKMQNGGKTNGRTWDLSIPTLARARLDDGSVGLVEVVAAYESGKREVFNIVLECGKRLRATADHRFLTQRGWVPLGELTVGDSVFVEHTKRPVAVASEKTKRPKALYLYRAARFHPHAAKRSDRAGGPCVLTHRLVFEAAMNGLEFDQFLNYVNHPVLASGLQYLAPNVLVHHRDENHRNNELSNLIAVTHKQHSEEHGWADHVKVWSVPSRVDSITRWGEEPTYDLTMAGPNNFIANGMVVHNSGKTSTAFRFIERVAVSSLVVVPNRALLDQWSKRVRHHFGIEPAIVQGQRKKPGALTIALQPSLLTCLDVLPYFGAIVCDEVQLFAAKTFNEIIEHCPARYRLGISGDERRADGKEYLIYDQFGVPTEQGIVQRADLLEQGHIVDVEVRFVASEFRADWYTQLPPKVKFQMRAKLIEEMGADDARNQVVLQAARWCLDEGEQVAILSMRREHCQRLDALLTSFCPSGLLLGGEGDRQAFEDSLKLFAAGDLKAVAGTFKAIGVGFETHAALARGVFAAPIATLDTAEQQVMQYLGRFARPSPGKQRAVVYFVYDPHVHGTKPIKLVRKWVRHCSVVTESGEVVTASEFLKAPRRHAQENRTEAPALPGIDTSRRGFYD